MRKTFTIWLVLGALMLSLFGNVLAVSVQASDIDPEAGLSGLSIDNLSGTENEQVSQPDAKAVIPQTADKQAEDDTAKDIEQPVTDPAVDSEEEPVDQESGQAEDSESPVDASGDLEEAQKQTEEDEPASEEDMAGEAADLEARSAEKDSPAEEEINTTEAEAEEADTDCDETSSSDDNEEDSSLKEKDEADSNQADEETTKPEDAKQDKRPEEEKVTPLDIIPQVLAQTETGQMVQEAVQDVAKYYVRGFEHLKNALKDTAKEIIIVITDSFEITETLTIEKGKNITLTAENDKKADGAWKHIEQPGDEKYREAGEEKQRKIIEEARRRGEEALKHGDLNKNPLPNEDENIILKRAESLLNSPLFRVYGTLTLGTVKSAIYVDGNEGVNNGGSLFEVSGTLNLENGVLMHANGNSAPVNVQNEGIFNMNGGRISRNVNRSGAGAVEVNPGGTFNLNNGLIDNNSGEGLGAIFAGNFGGSDKAPATINMNGGEIINNIDKGVESQGGAITLGPKSKLSLTDGIIAGNYSDNVGGGIAVTDNYIVYADNAPNNEIIETNQNYNSYEDFLEKFKAQANLEGGLIYKNKSVNNGGGIYINSNYVHFGTTMVLDNHAGRFGGGFYISFPPVTQKLDHVLATENTAKGGLIDVFGSGNGGGLWNCPTGFDRIGDGHSIYIFNNKAENQGADLSFSKKSKNFQLNSEKIGSEFYSHISPVTEYKNLIKFLDDSGNGDSLIPGHISYTQYVTYLKAVYSEALRKEAWSNSHTFILGNSARNGGGIGSNANIVTPTDQGDYNLEVKKNWDISTGGPAAHQDEEAVADIFIVPEYVDEVYVRSMYKRDPNLIKYGEIHLNSKNGWQSNFQQQHRDFGFWEQYIGTDFVKALGQDQGLFLDAQSLKDRGLKYLVMEEGDKYTTTVEEKPAEVKTVEEGKIKVSWSKSNHDFKNDPTFKYDPYDYLAKGNINIFLYHYNKDEKRLDLLTEGQINQNDEYPSVELSSELLKGNIKIEYYGKQHISYDLGFHFVEKDEEKRKGFSLESGHALILIDNPDGSKTLMVPYLWMQNYDSKEAGENSGFRVNTLPDTNINQVKTDHTFIITNYKPDKAEIQKNWDASVDQNKIPEAVTFTLFLDGKPVIESYDEHGKPIYRTVTLTKRDGWKSSIGHLNPLYLQTGRYSIVEEDNPNFKAKIEYRGNSLGEDVGFWLKLKLWYYDYQGKESTTRGTLPNGLRELIDENNPIKFNLCVDGKVVESKDYYWTSYVDSYGILRTNPVEDKTKFHVSGLVLDGSDIAIDYYDLPISDNGEINVWGLQSYNILLEKNERGIYTLRLPRLIYKGYAYEWFEVKKFDGSDFESGVIPHTQPIKFTFTATNYPKPTPPPPPEEPPEEPPYEPPTLRFSKPTPPSPPPTTRELIRLLPATSCVQAAKGITQ